MLITEKTDTNQGIFMNRPLFFYEKGFKPLHAKTVDQK
jgi:hypothetical protein